MASTLTPRPATATTSNPHRRNLSHHNTLTDTPTPQSQSSSSNSLSQLMQSLNNKQTIPTHSSHHSRPLKPLSHHSTRLSNIGNSIQHVEEIRPDDTELQRKEHEQSFERMMQELQDARISSSSEGESSSSRGGTRVTGQGKQRFRDEEGLRESDERTSDDYSDESPEDDEEDGSIRIGLSGVRYNSNNNRTAPTSTFTRQPLDQLAQLAQQEEDEVDHDSDDLTYLTIPRSQIDQLSPVKQQKESPLHPTTTTTSSKPLPPPPSSNLFTSSPARRPPHPISSAKENLPPSLPPPPPHNGARPFLSSFSPRPQPLRTSPFTSTTAPLQSQPQPNYRSSPLNPLQNSPILANQKTSSISTSQSQSHAVLSPPPAVQRKGGRPVTIEEVEDMGTPPRRVNTSFRRREESERNKSVKLPDMTFLTEALTSPVVVERKTSTTRRTAESKGSGSTGSKEAPLITGALSTLTSKLSLLESQNRESEQRVRELERQLSLQHAREQSQSQAQAQTRSRKEDAIASQVRDELRAERARRTELESLVYQLRQPQPAPLARPSVEACNTALELKEEVKDLRFGLEGLGYEVEGVRGVVEGLLRDKEGEGRERMWRREEEERRKSLQRDDDERGEKVSESKSESESGESRKSFISAQEIENLRREQEEEFKRRSSPKPKLQENVPKRRSTRRTQPAHVQRPVSVASSYDSLSDSSYSPSLQSSHSSASTNLTAPSESSVSQGQVEEPDFERATRIFEDVERAERRERRERVKEQERSEELCKRCKGKKRGEEVGVREGERKVELEREKEKEKEQEKVRRERQEVEKKRKQQEREMHCRTLQSVLEKLEHDFKSQKKIYLELTVEYQSMSSKSSTKKRLTLAQHLKMSIDVLEEKAKDVKQYADALKDLYTTALSTSSPSSKHQH